jgi:probable rRNA maturation factor
MNLIVLNNTYNIEKKFIEKVACAAFSYFEDKKGTIEFSFVSNNEIKRLCEVYKKESKVTDVLSFVLEKEPLLAQIFICYNISRIQAKENNMRFEEEVAHLLVHGILHSYGFDHQTLKEEEEMKSIEKIILKKVGITL